MNFTMLTHAYWKALVDGLMLQSFITQKDGNSMPSPFGCVPGTQHQPSGPDLVYSTVSGKLYHSASNPIRVILSRRSFSSTYTISVQSF